MWLIGAAVNRTSNPAPHRRGGRRARSGRQRPGHVPGFRLGASDRLC